MDQQLRNLVRDRAGNCCEYCGLRDEESPLASLHVEHVIPKKHGGTNDPSNLALACVACNLHKGPNVAGYDPQTGVLTALFHPRRDEWHVHFERKAVFINGRTAVGRTTVDVLQMNSPDRLELRTVIRPS
jgi:5-methylcytosine-specific restriction endonuclease McrA